MKALPQTQSIHSDLSDRTITLNLTLKAADVVSIRSCEVIGRSFRNRVSFQETTDIEGVLVGRLADAIRSCLKRLPGGAQVLALPEFLVEVPGLILSGLHIMIMEAKDGVRNAIFRFKEFIGGINNAFLTDLGFQETSATHSEKLAVNVLAEICLPIFNLCQTFEQMNLGKGTNAPEFILRAREFEFQTELLKRFVFNAGVGHAAATETYIDARLTPDVGRLAI
ncbi:hypothetical protein [Roseobacter weihaiensis]|uniref:hypothetical protein n=1 Tax=Roseobacter weihaiensis TaxID=2763262 RepID=UPI001D09C9F1|nr:hypothetical protein [Roseobacter sp. H9]